MEPLFKTFLALHIAGGVVSLLTGLVVLLQTKGTAQHRRLGRIFFVSLTLSALVAIPMSFLHPSYFLFLISIFTLYMLFSGVRTLKRKTNPALAVDWALTGAITLFGLTFMSLGIYNLLKGNLFGIVFIIFGAVGLVFARQDQLIFKGRSQYKNAFLVTHIQRLTGSYIASLTAFLVVNNRVLPGFVAWLLPTALLVPLLLKWSRKYAVRIQK